MLGVYELAVDAEAAARLTEVKAETKTGGTWASPTGVTEVGKVGYEYYGSGESNGSQNDLELVEITTPDPDDFKRSPEQAGTETS